MKRLIVVGLAASLAAALFGGFASESHAGFPLDPYIGAWESIDVDGSYQRLMIGGGPRQSYPPDPVKPPYPYHIVYFDHGAAACGGDQAIGIGYGMEEMMGDTSELVAELSMRCLKSHTALDGWMPMFMYEPEEDTLIQETAGGAIIWKRQGHNVGHPSQPSQ